MKSFKGRRLDRSQPVRVHRNLHRQVWSVRQGGRVVAHVEELMLKDAQFVVSDAGWKRSLRQGRRNVHAFVQGTVIEAPLPVAERGLGCGGWYNRRAGRFESQIATGLSLRQAKAVTFKGNRMQVYV